MIGIVADDVTGANDIGIMYAKNEWKTDVFLYPHFIENKTKKPDVLIRDTNSRLDTDKEAYDKIIESTKLLEDLNCTQYFNKTCSVFRGNIGVEFDAMLDALEEDFAVVVLGFPKNGRKTIHQEHYVHGVKLEESDFKDDPVHPMTESNLVDILQKQTNREVNAVDIETIRNGYKAIREEINNKRKDCNYLILDVENQQSLKEIAKAIKDEKVIAGSSGIAEELASLEPKKRNHTQTLKPEKQNDTGVLCVAGSLTPQTTEQITYLREKDFPVIEMKSVRLFGDNVEKYLDDVASKAQKLLINKENVLLHTTNNKEEISKTKQIAEQKGYSNEETSRVVSNAMASITEKIRRKTNTTRFLFAGGETSAAICNRLNIKGLRVYKEIEAGLPSCINLDAPHHLMILKSGSFGSRNFFEKAINHLEEY